MTIPYRPKPSGSPVIFAGGQVNISPEPTLVRITGAVLLPFRLCSCNTRTEHWWILKARGCDSYCSLVAGICCPRAARHSTAWCKWRALCKWFNIFKTSILGTISLFHPFDSFFTLLPLPVTHLLLKHLGGYTHVVYIYPRIFYFFMPHFIFFLSSSTLKGNICKIPAAKLHLPLSTSLSFVVSFHILTAHQTSPAGHAAEPLPYCT